MTDLPHILMVEDDDLIREMLGGALREFYTTTSVGTSGEALRRLREGGIKLILLDCTLPDGVAKELIPEADRSGIPVILMSGDLARIEDLSEQPRPFVVKPFAMTDLLTVLAEAMRARLAAC